MSYNSIRSMAPVAHCPKLQELYLAQNKLRELSGLENLSSLQKLDVGGNRIRSLQPVAQCTALVELWAGKNKVFGHALREVGVGTAIRSPGCYLLQLNGKRKKKYS